MKKSTGLFLLAAVAVGGYLAITHKDPTLTAYAITGVPVPTSAGTFTPVRFTFSDGSTFDGQWLLGGVVDAWHAGMTKSQVLAALKSQ